MDKLQTLGLILSVALLARLVLEGLHRVYPAFFIAMLFDLVSGLGLAQISLRSNNYAPAFFSMQAVQWVLWYFVLRELCLLVFRDHPGIRSAVGIGLRVSFVLALIVPLSVLAFWRIQADEKVPLLATLFGYQQTAGFFLSILFAGTLAFITWFPVSLRRNIIIYSVGLSIRIIGETGSVLLRNASTSPDLQGAASWAHMVMGPIAQALWLFWLSVAGEKPIVSVRDILHPGQAGEAFESLEKINRFLAKLLLKNASDK